MKSRWITLALCAIILATLILRLLPHRRNSGRADLAPRTHTSHSNAYLGLRGLVLQSTRANFGLAPGTSPTEPFAVVIDWGDPQGTTTIIAIADGSASVYSSNGTASIGGGQSNETIRNAALKTVEIAATAQPSMHVTKEIPLAERGQVNFYVVTDAGVFTASAWQDDLESNRSPFSPLAAAAKSIIAEYGRVSASR